MDFLDHHSPLCDQVVTESSTPPPYFVTWWTFYSKSSALSISNGSYIGITYWLLFINSQSLCSIWVNGEGGDGREKSRTLLCESTQFFWWPNNSFYWITWCLYKPQPPLCDQIMIRFWAPTHPKFDYRICAWRLKRDRKKGQKHATRVHASVRETSPRSAKNARGENHVWAYTQCQSLVACTYRTPEYSFFHSFLLFCVISTHF